LSPVNVTQGAGVDASHVQSRVVVTFSEPVPPAAGTVDGALSTVTWHFADVGDVTDRSEELQAAAPAATRIPTISRTANVFRIGLPS
jgi:hypothetical protein